MQNYESLDVKYMFAKRLKKLRNEKGVSQDVLAEKIGISRASISFYEKAERTPDIEIFNKIANYFGVSLNYLIGKANAGRPENENIGEVTGLSDNAIAFLRDMNEKNQHYVSEFFNSFFECLGIQSLAYSFYELKNLLKDPEELFENPIGKAESANKFLEGKKYLDEQEKRIENESGHKVAILHDWGLFKHYVQNVESGFNKMILGMTGHNEDELRKIYEKHMSNTDSIESIEVVKLTDEIKSQIRILAEEERKN